MAAETTEDVYVKEPVRIGRLKLMSLSPAHYRWAEQPQTSSMSLGKALHEHVLLGKEIAVATMRRDARTKAYQEFLDSSKDKLVLTDTEARHVRGMAASLRRHDKAPELLAGVIERTHHWDWMARACRGTPDVLRLNEITELKTTRCSQPDWFRRDAHKRGYDTQLVWYDQGIRHPANRNLWIVAVESAAPYAVVCYQLTDDRREQAARQCRLWFERLLQCEASRHWPAYTEQPQEWGVGDRSQNASDELDLTLEDEVLA